MSAPHVVVLASGSGTNFQAIIDATRAADETQRLAVEIVGLYSHAASAMSLRRAERYKIPHAFVAPPPRSADRAANRVAWDRALAAKILHECGPVDLVVMVGWTRVMSPEFIAAFPCPMINLHPSVPGDLVGLDAIERAYDEFSEGRRTESGVMVHGVVQEIDAGPVVVSEVVLMEAGLDFETFVNRMHAVEHRLVVAAVRRTLFPG